RRSPTRSPLSRRSFIPRTTRSEASSLAGEWLVGEPTPACLGEQGPHPVAVVHLVGGAQEVVLGEVAVQMLAAHTVVGAVDGALQLAEVRLGQVRRRAVAVDVLVAGVVDGLVALHLA